MTFKRDLPKLLKNREFLSRNPFRSGARKSPIRRASTSASLQTEAESLSSLGASNQIKFLLQIKCSFLLEGILLPLPMVGGLSH